MRTGDVVRHEPSDEEWLVAWADKATGELSPCGWPICVAKISDCRVIAAAADSDARNLAARLCISGRIDANRAAEIGRRDGWFLEGAQQ